MTNEKMLSLINKAIENLRDNEDGYGQTPIDFMRKNAIKSTDNMTIFLDSVGVYLEELRQGILADIEAVEAKKNGKSSALSAVKKMYKEAYSYCINKKPYFAYAHYDESENQYWLTNTFWMIVSKNADGMTLCPENIEKNATPFNYKSQIADISDYEKLTLPSIGKVSAYLKQAKAKAPKKPLGWDRIILTEKLGVKGEWLENLMKITGATEIYYKYPKAMVMEGNGYKAMIMPIQVKCDEPITDFDNV